MNLFSFFDYRFGLTSILGGSEYPNKSMDEIQRVETTANYPKDSPEGGKLTYRKIGDDEGKDIELADVGVDSVAIDSTGDYKPVAPKDGTQCI